MSRHVLVFRDFKEFTIERAGNGELLLLARADDPAIDAVGIRCFARPALPGAGNVTLVNVPVHFVRLFAREHGGVELTWTENAAIKLLKAAAAAETPLQSSPDIPPDPPEIAEVLRRPREAASQAVPFHGADGPVCARDPVLDAPGLRPLVTDTVMACLEEARARFTEEVVRPIERPSDPFYAMHCSPARVGRVKVSALRIISEVLDAALEPEFAGHPRLGGVQVLKARIAELAVKWRTEALQAEGNSRRAA